MKNLKKDASKRNVTLDGMMSFGQLKNGLHTAQFDCIENVNMESMNAKCKVQIMRDGNVYITELPKRHRNNAIYREDNCSLTLGNDGRYHFVFTLHKERINELPSKLVQQAGVIARKVMMDLIGNY